jgi:hypothetical protein
MHLWRPAAIDEQVLLWFVFPSKLSTEEKGNWI